MIPGDEIDGDLGRLDVIAMDEIRSAFTDLDGLIRAAGFETPADPETVHVYLADGIGAATECRFDIRCMTGGTMRSITPTLPVGIFAGITIQRWMRRTDTFTRHRMRARRIPNRPASPSNNHQSSRESSIGYGGGRTIRGTRT